MARRSKTLEEQCKYYECDNFTTDILLNDYYNGQRKQMVEHYKELNIDSRKSVIAELFELFGESEDKNVLEQMVLSFTF